MPRPTRRIHAGGRKVALSGIENGYPIGTDLTNVRKIWSGNLLRVMEAVQRAN